MNTERVLENIADRIIVREGNDLGLLSGAMGDVLFLFEYKGHKTKCNKMEDDRKRLYTLIFK